MMPDELPYICLGCPGIKKLEDCPNRHSCGHLAIYQTCQSNPFLGKAIEETVKNWGEDSNPLEDIVAGIVTLQSDKDYENWKYILD